VNKQPSKTKKAAPYGTASSFCPMFTETKKASKEREHDRQYFTVKDGV